MHYIWTWALQRHLHDTHARSKAGRSRPSSACLFSWRDPLRTAVSLSLYAPPAFSMPPAATAPPAPAAGATPNTLPAPAQPHSFTRVTVPGTDKELDYVSVTKGADVVKAFPKLGWVDSSSLSADTVAAPLLSIAGVVCLPAFIEDPTTPASRTILGLAEITVVPSLAFVAKCACRRGERPYSQMSCAMCRTQ